MFKGKSSAAGVSSFQALSIALSGRVGTGNIAGTATAIAMGGPGAVFWMWAIAFIGAGSAFVESTLAQIYKVKKTGYTEVVRPIILKRESELNGLPSFSLFLHCWLWRF